MTAVDNIVEAWAELQPAAMNSAWRKPGPSVCWLVLPSPVPCPSSPLSIEAPASHAGMGDVAKADVSHLLQALEPTPTLPGHGQWVRLWLWAALPGWGRAWPLEDRNREATEGGG